MDVFESTQQIQDGSEHFNVTILGPKEPTCIVIFAAGRGGNPMRHLSLLQAVAKHGCLTVAPHFNILLSTVPTIDEINTRIHKLELALKRYSRAGLPIIGIGHSLGCVLLLALAGAKACTLSGHQVISNSKWVFGKLALFAPPLAFFGYPGALKSIDTPSVYLRAGNKDTITPPDQISMFKKSLEIQTKVEFVVDKNAGHFSYMDELPPNVEDVQPERHAFLLNFVKDVIRFVTTF
jgi:predicted alpha/beta hydrolase family esterase